MTSRLPWSRSTVGREGGTRSSLRVPKEQVTPLDILSKRKVGLVELPTARLPRSATAERRTCRTARLPSGAWALRAVCCACPGFVTGCTAFPRRHFGHRVALNVARPSAEGRLRLSAGAPFGGRAFWQPRSSAVARSDSGSAAALLGSRAVRLGVRQSRSQRLHCQS